MSSFWTFLLEKKKVDHPDLLNAFIQIENQSPSLLEIAREIIADDTACIRELLESQEKGVSYYEWLKADPERWSLILERLGERQSALSSTLVEQGVLNASEMNSLIDEYGELIKEQSSQESSESEEPEISEAALESMRELVEQGTMDPQVLHDLEKKK